MRQVPSEAEITHMLQYKCGPPFGPRQPAEKLSAWLLSPAPSHSPLRIFQRAVLISCPLSPGFGGDRDGVRGSLPRENHA